MEREVVIEVGGQEETKRYTFVCVEATVGNSLERSIFRRHGEKYLESLAKQESDNGRIPKPTTLSARNITVLAIYPDLMSLTQSITVEKLDDKGNVVDTAHPEFTPGEFRELKDVVTNPWSDVVYELNPHWLPSAEDEDDEVAVGKETKNGD